MSSAATAPAVLDREFLDIRARVLELAAALDRLDRADGSVGGDARMAAIAQAIDIVRDSKADRAERVQLIFSRPYEKGWRQKLGVVPR
ncbi:MAG: hypothetical protein HYX69_20850 [Planctomycetia bacterium]|nr:hypothetical protein [Planctomycetia bacterium]